MTDNRCHVEHCTRPAGTAYICRSCTNLLQQTLAEIPWLHDELDVTITRQVRFSTSQPIARDRETPVPFAVHAADVARELHAIMVSWVRMLAEEHPNQIGWTLPADTDAALSGWLLRHVTTIRHHDQGGILVGEVTDITTSAKVAIDRSPNRTSFNVGPCPEVGDAMVDCPGEVRAYIPADKDTLARMVCTVCGATWYGWQWLRAGRRILDKAERTRQAQRSA